jgi:hypothetical protein
MADTIKKCHHYKFVSHGDAARENFPRKPPLSASAYPGPFTWEVCMIHFTAKKAKLFRDFNCTAHLKNVQHVLKVHSTF